MERFVLAKERLSDFLNSLQNYEVVAPVKRHQVTAFEAIANPQQAPLDLVSQPHPPKRFIFPQTEVLFTFDKSHQVKEPKPPQGKKTRVLFGIRPCDARAFSLMDPVFEKDYPDPYYLEKRKSTVLIGLQCSQPFSNCFCTSVGGDPSFAQGIDLLMADLGERYFLQVLTPHGDEIVKTASPVLSSPSEEDEKEMDKLNAKSKQNVHRAIPLQGIMEKIEQHFHHSLWKELAQKCISCGICTYTCPTCHCFDIQDERIKGKGKRVRVWDSCMYREYTLHASGHNPRPTRVERFRNRMYHKFKQSIELNGVPGCVGCGRCTTLCPASEDLIENLQAIQSL